MTQVAGISATILLQTFDAKPVYRIWCDGTYGEFMSDVLQEIASEVA
jgi:sarcosine oxidase subunit gamma